MQDYQQQLTLFTGDSPASLSVWQVTKTGQKTLAISGQNFRALSPSLCRVGWLLKTYLESFVSQLTQFVPTWSVKATPSGYGIMKLRLSARNTGENESFLWRTPTAHDYRGANSPEKFKERMEKGLPLSLNNQVAHFLPTPTASAYKDCGQNANKNRSSLGWAAKMLPTPLAHDSHKVSPTDYERHSPPLGCYAQGSGSLNPNWIEHLMGLPQNWTAL